MTRKMLSSSSSSCYLHLVPDQKCNNDSIAQNTADVPLNNKGKKNIDMGISNKHSVKMIMILNQLLKASSHQPNQTTQ